MNLKEYIYTQQTTIKQFAWDLGYTRSYMTQIALGHRKPSKRLAKAIEKLTHGIVRERDLIQQEIEDD